MNYNHNIICVETKKWSCVWIVEDEQGRLAGAGTEAEQAENRTCSGLATADICRYSKFALPQEHRVTVRLLC